MAIAARERTEPIERRPTQAARIGPRQAMVIAALALGAMALMAARVAKQRKET